MNNKAREIVSDLCDEWHFACMGGSEKTPKQILDQHLTALKTLLKERIETLRKDRFLKKDKLEYQLGWVEGHKIALSEVLKIIDEVFDGGKDE